MVGAEFCIFIFNFVNVSDFSASFAFYFYSLFFAHIFCCSLWELVVVACFLLHSFYFSVEFFLFFVCSFFAQTLNLIKNHFNIISMYRYHFYAPQLQAVCFCFCILFIYTYIYIIYIYVNVPLIQIGNCVCVFVCESMCVAWGYTLCVLHIGSCFYHFQFLCRLYG